MCRALIGEWPVGGPHKVADGILKAGGGTAEWYSPVDRPEVVESLADVRNAADLVRFADRFGMLGYGPLAVRELRRGEELDPKYGGDPVGWCLWHARRVEACLHLTALLKDGARTLRAELPEVLRSAGMGLASWTEWKTESAKNPELRQWLVSTAWPRDPIKTAYLAIAEIINPYAKGIHAEMTTLRGGQPPGLHFKFTALIEAVYYMLATDIALRKIVTCGHCGIHFLAKRDDAKFHHVNCRVAASRLAAKRRRRVKR